MDEAITLLTANFAEENGLNPDTATKLVTWLDNEGILDYDIVRETYSEGVRD